MHTWPLEKGHVESFYIIKLRDGQIFKRDVSLISFQHFLLTKLFDRWSKWGVWMTDFEMWWRFLFIQEARLAIIRPSVKVVEYLCKWEEVGVDPLFRTPLPAFSDQCNAHRVPRQTLKIPLTVVKGGARVVIRCLQLVSALACGWVEPSSIGQPHLNPTQGCQSRLRWWWRKYIF